MYVEDQFKELYNKVFTIIPPYRAEQKTLLFVVVVVLRLVTQLVMRLWVKRVIQFL